MKKKIALILDVVKEIKYDKIIMALMGFYFIVSTIMTFKTTIKFSNLMYTSEVALAGVIFITIGLTIALEIFIYKLSAKWEAYLLEVAMIFYGMRTLWKNEDFYYSIGVIVVIILITYFLIKNDYFNELSKIKYAKPFVIGAGVFFFLYVGGLTTLRYICFSTECFDFGIFSQMFYYMKETLMPMTTCERNELLSHFAIHFSPIFYLFLPIYAIFPSPATLEILQALILASGIIPLYLICKKYEMKNYVIICICSAYSLFPALMGGCFFDLHENKFLTPLILWLFYFIEKKKTLWIFIFMGLVLLVKEDAPVYVACIALYMMLYRKEWKKGSIMFVSSIVYFGVVTTCLKLYGRGIMTDRYSNYMLDPDGGLTDMIINLIKDPALLIFESFTVDKLVFALLMLLPVAFIPLICKKPTQLFLLIPFLLVNLMPDYQPQYSIDYQYTYGVTAIFFYLVVVNGSELPEKIQKYVFPFMLITSLMLCTSQMSGKLSYIDMYRWGGDYRAKINDTIDHIPEDASLEVVDTVLFANASQRKVAYVTNYDTSACELTDYVLIRVSANPSEKLQNKLDSIIALGYVYDYGYEDTVALYKLNK